MANDPTRLHAELGLLTYLDDQITEVERVYGSDAAAPLRAQLERQAERVVDGDTPGRLIHLARLPGRGFLRVSEIGQAGFIRATVATVQSSTVDYSFVTDPGLKARLVQDNRMMEDAVCGVIAPCDSERERFVAFCIAAQCQLEPLVRYYYLRKGLPLPKAPTAKNSTYSSQIYDIGRIFFPNLAGFPDYRNKTFRMIGMIRCLRNTIQHRFYLPDDQTGLARAVREGPVEIGQACELLLVNSPRLVRKALMDIVDRIRMDLQGEPPVVVS